MKRRWQLALAGSLAALWLAAPPPAAAQAKAGEDAEPRWHIVRPGETLERIAGSLFGSVSRWVEIWRLNPAIANPHHIVPGQRVRIPVFEKGASSATIRRLSREVAERPAPNPWSPAQVGDSLLERDGVRTYAKSSAEMRFNDGTRLLVSEDSLVYLQRRDGALAGVARKGVEIVEGQADYEATAAGRPAVAPGGVEIVLGPARMTSRPDRGGGAQARARRPRDGGSKVMVYGGEGEVEAAGAKVLVPQGSGSSIPREGPPGPAEPLLPAPRTVSPAAGAELAFANPAFLWEPLPAAAAYVVELCRDERCGTLLDRAVVAAEEGSAGAGGEWQAAAPLPVGELFWRVTARSRSGLDGYPSAAARLAILADRVDREPPAARLTLNGPQASVGATLFAAPSVEVVASAEDALCGIGRVAATLDGRALAGGPLAAGPHTAGGVAVDRCGNRADLPPLAWVVDAEPPAVRWEVGDRQLFVARGEPRAARPTAGRGKAAAAGPRLDWTSDGRAWRALFAAGTAGVPPVYGDGEIASDRPQVFLAPAGLDLTVDGKPLALGPGQLVWIQAEDAGCGVARLSLRVRTTAASPPAAGPGNVLEIDAVDLVGNARHLEWPLVPR